MNVTRATYRRLLDLHEESRTAMLLSSGRAAADVCADAALRVAILQHVRAVLDTSHAIRFNDERLLRDIDPDINSLDINQPDWDDLPSSLQRIHERTAALIETIQPPRWTTLGLRHRRRRQMSRIRKGRTLS